MKVKSSLLLISLGSILIISIYPLTYNNLSWAKIELPEVETVAIDVPLPDFNVTVEYNEQSVYKEAKTKTENNAPLGSVPLTELPPPEEEPIEGSINGNELVEHYGITPPPLDKLGSENLTNFEHIGLEELLDNLQARYAQGEDPIVLSMSATAKDPPAPEKDNLSPTLRQAIDREMQQRSTSQTKHDPSLPPGNKFPIALRAYSPRLDGQDISFQFIPHYNRSEIFSSDQDGIVSIQTKKTRQGLLRGSIVAEGKMPTNIDIPLKKSGGNFEVPLMDITILNFFANSSSEDDENSGFLLVAIGDNVEDADLSCHYSSRIFLDQAFREVTKEQDYAYILFINTELGNETLFYRLQDGSVTRKIVHLSDEEIFYDFGHIASSRYEQIELYKRNLFSTKSAPLTLTRGEVAHFGEKLDISSKGLNRYEFKRPPFVEGDRNYIQISGLESDSTLYVGYRGQEKKLEIPGRDFIEHILEGFDLIQLDNDCVIQLNFPVFPTNAVIRLNDAQMEANMSVVYLNDDGTFSESPSVNTTKAFLWGEGMGIFSGKIEYSDDTTSFFNSFCSPGTYLVEEL